MECQKCGASSPGTDFIKPRPHRKPMCRPCDNEMQREHRYARLGTRRRVGESEDFTCDTCSQTFTREVTTGKRKSRCDACLRSQFNERARAKWREGYLRRTYGLTVSEFDSMAEAQGNICAICQTDQPAGRHGEWVVDHDHETGAVRGLLCNNCNRGIGLMQDSPKVLASAIEYLLRAAAARAA